MKWDLVYKNLSDVDRIEKSIEKDQYVVKIHVKSIWRIWMNNDDLYKWLIEYFKNKYGLLKIYKKEYQIFIH